MRIKDLDSIFRQQYHKCVGWKPSGPIDSSILHQPLSRDGNELDEFFSPSMLLPYQNHALALSTIRNFSLSFPITKYSHRNSTLASWTPWLTLLEPLGISSSTGLNTFTFYKQFLSCCPLDIAHASPFQAVLMCSEICERAVKTKTIKTSFAFFFFSRSRQIGVRGDQQWHEVQQREMLGPATGME